jgi:hypothetical protein
MWDFVQVYGTTYLFLGEIRILEAENQGFPDRHLNENGSYCFSMNSTTIKWKRAAGILMDITEVGDCHGQG